MKKIYSILAALVASVCLLTSCSDVPMPYEINKGEDSFGKNLPYKSANLNSNWSIYSLTEEVPWTMGSNYVSATGYQQWEGDSKTNKEVEGYLISPAFNTKCESGKVKLTFDHVIMYASKDKDYASHIGLYVSKNYDGLYFNGTEEYETVWEKIPFTIESKATPSTSDWTCYTIPEIQLPDEYVNVDGVYFAFYFYAPSDKSITWELKNFVLTEGEANTSSDTPDTPQGAGSKESPLSVAQAQTISEGTGYVTGYIVGYVDGTKLAEGAKFQAAPADAETKETEILIADSPDETSTDKVFPVQLPAGDIRTLLSPNTASNIGKKAIVYGTFTTYFGTNGMKQTSWASLEGQTAGTDPDAPETPAADPKGDGTKEKPFNVSAAIQHVQKLGADTNSAEVYVEGIVCSTPSIDTGSYGNGTFYISDDGTDANKFYVFRTFDYNMAKFTDANKVKKGDKVVIYGPIVNYKGDTPETVASKTCLYSINGVVGETPAEEPEPEIVGGQGITISDNQVIIAKDGVREGSTIEIDLSTFEIANGASMDTIPINMKGIEIRFDKGTNKNTPKYYDGTKGVRVYSDNIVTITGAQDIVKVVFVCDVYEKDGKTTIYVGNTTANASIDGNNVTYTNSDPNGKNVQLRVQKILVTYAYDDTIVYSKKRK